MSVSLILRRFSSDFTLPLPGGRQQIVQGLFTAELRADRVFAGHRASWFGPRSLWNGAVVTHAGGKVRHGWRDLVVSVRIVVLAVTLFPHDRGERLQFFRGNPLEQPTGGVAPRHLL